MTPKKKKKKPFLKRSGLWVGLEEEISLLPQAQPGVPLQTPGQMLTCKGRSDTLPLAVMLPGTMPGHKVLCAALCVVRVICCG